MDLIQSIIPSSPSCLRGKCLLLLWQCYNDFDDAALTHVLFQFF